MSIPVIKFLGEKHPLSNFYQSDFSIHKIVFPTVEHFYQSEKPMDIRDQIKITIAKTPQEAKKVGREVICRPGWDKIRLRVMWRALNTKFRQSDHLKAYLLGTGDSILIEDNHYDNYWGIGNGTGKNMLGKMLMLLRKKLREEMEK